MAVATGRLLTLEDDGGRCRATGDDEMMQVGGGWKSCFFLFFFVFEVFFFGGVLKVYEVFFVLKGFYSFFGVFGRFCF